ncbi:MAG TPA: DUF1015 domain-containing protein [Fimbriimonadaceae bacterium]|nr:DUF1015 domain-containing protein [Fimbriimonadaceae bacterium]
MATIRPFRGLRYTSKAGRLDKLTAPPYDVLTPAERDGYAARNPHNVVHLTLPESQPDDRSKYIKYARSGALLAEWRREEVLAPEPAPAFYRYVQRYDIPGTPETLERTALIALIKTEPYDKGVVLPHEQTFPKHKEDRLRLLEATHAHLECIFGLFEDPDRSILDAIHAAPAGTRVETESDEGVFHILEPVSDPAATAQLSQMLVEKKVWIADGHHRYETACSFRAALGERPSLVAEDFMMMALSSMSDPGLVLLPTHRIVAKLPIPSDTLLAELAPYFDVRETHSTRLIPAIEEARDDGQMAFGLALEGGRGFVLTALNPPALAAMVPGDHSMALKQLDVSILHSIILERLVGLQGLDQIAYTRDGREATRLVDEGAAAAFLMNPPTVEDMRTIALGGEKMPQKSTYYYPKILSGLVMWSLNDF